MQFACIVLSCRSIPIPRLIASDLRVVLGHLVRRLRAERRFPLAQSAVLGRLEREGPACVSDLAVAERVRPQSMAQTVGDLEADGLVARHPDPVDRRRSTVELTGRGLLELQAERRRRDGWLASVVADDLSSEERDLLGRSVELLRRIAES